MPAPQAKTELAFFISLFAKHSLIICLEFCNSLIGKGMLCHLLQHLVGNGSDICSGFGVITPILEFGVRSGTTALRSLYGKINGTRLLKQSGNLPVQKNRMSCAPCSSNRPIQDCSFGRIYFSANTTEVPS